MHQLDKAKTQTDTNKMPRGIFKIMKAANQKFKILIADNDTANIKLLFDALPVSDYEVWIAKTDEKALKIASRFPAELILLDAMMPNGFEICRRLKADKKTEKIPIILMTALSDTVDKVKGLKLGAVDYITKPIQYEEAIVRINAHLRLYRLNQYLEEMVDERTATLTQELKEIQQNQFKLIQSEKMSSFSQLVADVASEIDNPVNFIQGNLSAARDYSRELLYLADLCLRHQDRLPIEIKAYLEETDLKFISQDFLSLFNSLEARTDRLQRTIRTLRNFARLHESEMKLTNLRNGIKST